MKKYITEYNEQTEIDLDAVRTNNIVGHNNIVRTETDSTISTNTVRTETDVVRTDEPVGKFDKYHDVYPERMEICFKRGGKQLLKDLCRARGFSSVSTMIRSGIAFLMMHPEFKNGWDKE